MKPKLCATCGKEAPKYYWKCIGCNKFIHGLQKCSVALEVDCFTEVSYGDYQERVCLRCNEKLMRLKPYLDKIHEKYAEEIDKEYKFWRNCCANH